MPSREPYSNATGLTVRIAKALGHPLRVEMLRALEAPPSKSASSLARQLGFPLANVSYHLKILAETSMVLERVRTRSVRGATEVFYRLKPRESFGPVNLSAIPLALGDGVRRTLLKDFIERTEAAFAAGTDKIDGTTLEYRSATLDEQGWGEASAVVDDVSARLAVIEDGSRERLRAAADPDDGALQVMFGVAFFQIRNVG